MFIDLSNKRFGRLIVIRRVPKKNVGRHAYFLCRCDCGKEKVINGCGLRTGRTRSCGCYKIEVTKAVSTTHGMRNSRAFAAWAHIKQRCGNPKDAAYERYGGRGISVCERWYKFENFLEDMGHPPKGLTIDRIDNNGNYEPGNCRWATYKEQANNKGNNRVICFNGQSKTLMQWCEHLKISNETLRERLSRWPLERALTTPNMGTGRYFPRIRT